MHIQSLLVWITKVCVVTRQTEPDMVKLLGQTDLFDPRLIR